MQRSAFTLMELLVVVVIIGLLAAILFPAVNMAREAARRTQCISRQRDLALALTDYSVANNGLPGYLNQLGETPIHSWAVAVLPGIGENRRYEILMTTPNDETAVVPLPALLCPSDNPKEDRRLNYVVNCGPSDELLYDFMLFKDRRMPLALTNKRYKIEEIPDGAAGTVLLSENVQYLTESREDGSPVLEDGSLIEGIWHRDWPALSDAQPPLPRDTNILFRLGFVWARPIDYPNAYLPVSSVNTSTPGTDVPRPSSRHPGTFVAAFADGSARAINDDIAIDDWLRLANPDNRGWQQLFQ